MHFTRGILVVFSEKVYAHRSCKKSNPEVETKLKEYAEGKVKEQCSKVHCFDEYKREFLKRKDG